MALGMATVEALLMGNGDPTLMARTARARFVRFTKDEIADIYAYLLRMPATPAPAAATSARR